ncbi:NAD-binding protein [Auriscalpium vulgare]|uniref:NAD-binding protein n=1 Tax=Auriscalpium vulgare TaxID=40419 RepID=A0ACB8RGU9_9AGAM|nr:NAD-binding protein [Auriscalpium vulgare]
MSAYKVIAVAGAGNLGMYIVRELLAAKAAGTIDGVVVLTRYIVPVSYAPEAIDTLTAALASHGVDALVSTLSHKANALSVQPVLARAAHAAGVRLFVPSEFGNPTAQHAGGAGVFGQKGNFQGELKELGLPSAVFYTGPFSDQIFKEFLGWDIENGKVEAGADGNVPVSYTARKDVARFVVYALTTQPPAELEWRTFRIEGDRKTMNELFAAYQVKTGKTLNPRYLPEDELAQTLKKNPGDFARMLQLSWVQHGGTVGRVDELDNGAYAEWNPASVVDLLV